MRLQFEVPGAAQAQLSVYDAAGRKVRDLQPMKANIGLGYAIWDGRNERGNLVAGGVYFVRLRAGTSVRTQRLIWLD
jgi:hypothetical protein